MPTGKAGSRVLESVGASGALGPARPELVPTPGSLCVSCSL